LRHEWVDSDNGWRGVRKEGSAVNLLTGMTRPVIRQLVASV